MPNKDDTNLNNNDQPRRLVYRVRRSTSARSEIIPENEKKLPEDKILSDFASSIADTVKKPFEKIEDSFMSDKQQRSDIMTYRKKNPLDKRMIFLTLLICGIIMACTFMFIPLAFSSETHTIHMNDSGREFTAESAAKTVGDFLDYNGITLSEYDYVDLPLDTEITDDMNIVIRRAMDLTINTKDNTYNVTMLAGTVEDALEMAGVEIKDCDEIYPTADTYVRNGMTIDYVEVVVEYETETQAVGFREVTRESEDLYVGETKLVQNGKEGEKAVTYKKIYKNGSLYSTEVDSEEITVEPQNEITLVGTKEKEVAKPKTKETKNKPKNKKKPTNQGGSGGSSATVTDGDSTIEINGKIYNVKAVYNSQVTAYCSHCDPSGVGASGAALTRGSLAADTSVFPYGTKIYIPGYGIGYVVDKGGGIKGTRIDVYMGTQDDETACNKWGRKNLKIYVLD